MAAPFEMYLEIDRDVAELKGIAEAAYERVGRLDAQLSSFVPTSDICLINQTAAERAVAVEPELFALLRTAQRLWRETDGAFDVTVGPLIRAWGFFRREGRMPEPAELADARARTGMQHVELDEANRTVRFDRPGMEINLGAIGKGYVVERAVRALRDWGIEAALVHSGQSSIAGLGRPAGEEAGWLVGVADPRDPEKALGLLYLADSSLSTSGGTEQFFKLNGRTYSHIIDPRTGEPAQGMLATAVVGPGAAESDALATAFFVMGVDKARVYCQGNKDFAAVLLSGESADQMQIDCVSIELDAP
jgi:thiamine biosynthesis lipoprotein